MRKISYFLILCVVLAISACSKSEIPSEEESKEQVNVSFLAQPDVVVTAGTRAAAASLVDAKKFSFYAFKRNKDGKTYSFTKEISGASEGAGAKYDGSVWSSNLSQLPVGTYNFLCLYNVGAAQSVSGIEGVKGLEWPAIQNGIIIEHLSASADVDEFFSGEVADVAITGSNGNSIVVDFGALKRVPARIDVKFVKIAADKNEVSYKEGKTIFGDDGNLQSIKQTVTGLANKFSFGEMSPTLWGEKCKFEFGPNLVTFGKSSVNSTFPTKEEEDMDNTENMKNGIIKGGAYFRGAYVLPFMTEEAKLKEVLIYLTGKPKADGEVVDRTITVTNGNGIELSVKKNFITLITVKLLSTTATGPGDGDDEEHLFNPKVKFTVSVDSKYGGVSNSDVEVE